jgi:hypothetical protein
MTFKLPAIALAVIIALVALGPLAFFVPRLAALRRQESWNMAFSARFRAAISTKNGSVIVAGTKQNF